MIEEVRPAVDGGRYPLKRVVGEPVDVEAAVYADGHDRLWGVVAHRPPGEGQWLRVPMVQVSEGLDLWRGVFTPEHPGRHRFRVVAWIDAYGSWLDATIRKIDAGVDVVPDLLEGAAIVDAAAATVPAREREPYRTAADRIRSGDTAFLVATGSEDGRAVAELARAALRVRDAAVSKVFDVVVERERALFGAWYELFPRSWGKKPGVHGTLRDVEANLDYVADMGFDVLYLPPLHPIGRAFRKGPNNTERARVKDPGSPWAIGSAAGGHDAIHPELGTLADFASLRGAVERHGMELAMDFALQCSPDHPWVSEHPGWFRHRPDGTIRYAENPPKKYQDIYPLDFDSPQWRSLWEACLGLLEFWAARGVRIFRVDNPHTKPFAFWQWIITEMRERHDGVIFLSEAFTRPKVMRQLARVGFTQSYSYFPWRTSAHELTEYFTELSNLPSVDELRPSCWPNTPDILAWHLMDAPRSVFAARVFLAALLSPSYGIYGPALELGDNRAAGNGKEEYLDSEKYQLRWWDRADPASLRGLVTELNRIRSGQRALHTLRTLRFHGVDNGGLVCFSKTVYGGPSVDAGDPANATMLMIANVAGIGSQSGTVWLDLGALGVDPSRPFDVVDMLTGRGFTWMGPDNYVELHPEAQPGHIFRITQP